MLTPSCCFHNIGLSAICPIAQFIEVVLSLLCLFRRKLELLRRLSSVDHRYEILDVLLGYSDDWKETAKVDRCHSLILHYARESVGFDDLKLARHAGGPTYTQMSQHHFVHRPGLEPTVEFSDQGPSRCMTGPLLDTMSLRRQQSFGCWAEQPAETCANELSHINGV